MDNNTLQRRLQEYGADVSGINSRFLWDLDLYAKCLSTFPNDTSFEMLKTAINNSSYIEAFEAAHALKGLTGNLGLTPLYNALCLIVESLRAKRYDGIASEFASVETEYLRIIMIISSLS